MRGTIKAPLQTGLGNELGWSNNSMPHINLGYGGQQGLGQVAHHMNPNLTPQGNVNAGGLQNAREEQFRRTGQPFGTGFGEPSGAELQEIINRMKLENQNQSSNLPTSIPQSGTTFGVGNNEGLVANAALNPLFGGDGGRQNFTNAVTNPIEFLLGGEGGKKEFQNINVEDLLKGGRSNASDGNEQRLLQAMQYGRLNGSIPTFNQGGVAT